MFCFPRNLIGGTMESTTELSNVNQWQLLLFRYVFTIASYLIGVFVFATIVGKIGCI